MVAGSLALASEPASAQEGLFAGMQRGVESVFSAVSTTTISASGIVTRTTTRNIYPSLTLNLNALVFPALQLNAGGVFELNLLSIEVDRARSRSTITRNRPFFLLRSTNPVLSPGIGYSRREDRARTAGLSNVKLVNDEYSAHLGWNIEGGPRSNLQFLKTHTFDGERAFQDVTKDFGSIVSNYRYRNLGANYRGSYIKTTNQIQQLETRQVSQGARLDYSGAFIAKRLLWNATYNLNHQDLRTMATGDRGEVELPVIPFAGLSSISDTPVTAALAQNAPLIDGNLTASAGIDLGLPLALGDAQLRNIGLDLLTRTEVNRLLVWVDRDLPVDVANAFAWEVYSSEDNVIWRRESAVSAAPFGPFENRFQIDFTAITARHIKAVTRPLSAVVPDSSRFQDIFVTEIQAFVRRPAGQAGTTLEQTSHLFSTDVRMRLLNTPSLFYEGFYLSNGPNFVDTTTGTLSNGVSISHTFNRMFSAYARAAREQGIEPKGRRTATITTATLTFEPIPTFRSSVLYSGQNGRTAGAPNTTSAVFIQNAARPYQGIDVLFGMGWNSTTRDTGEMSHDRLINVSATVVPRSGVSLVVSYDERSTERSGSFTGSPQSLTRRTYASVSVDPLRTFHLVLGGEVIVSSGQARRTTLDIGANWTPFPDGTLQFVFASNEALRALEFGKDRSTVGAVRWNVSSRSYLDVSYQRTRSEFVLQTVESRIFNVSARLFR